MIYKFHFRWRELASVPFLIYIYSIYMFMQFAKMPWLLLVSVGYVTVGIEYGRYL